MRIEIFSPIGWNVAALYDQVLSVLNCGLDDLADNGPQIFCKSIIVLRRQTGIAAPDQAPHLCNFFCAHECAIGKQYVPEIKAKELSQIILEMLASLNSVQKKQERLIEITADGKIEKDEMGDFIKIQEELERISITVETLQLWIEQKLAAGHIDIKSYKTAKNNSIKAL